MDRPEACPTAAYHPQYGLFPQFEEPGKYLCRRDGFSNIQIIKDFAIRYSLLAFGVGSALGFLLGGF
jgi:hypothetical protein